ncbi:MAG: septum formation initiator family protein [Thermacetogeniaceae bacterium]
MVLAENSYSPGTARARVRNKNQPRKRPRNRPRNKAHKKTLIYFRVIVLILCGFGLGLYYINMNHQVTALGYQLEAQKEKVAMLQRDYKQLELKAAELQCPDRVEEVAVSKLGMHKPDSILLAALPAEDQTATAQEQNKGEQGQDSNSWSLAFLKWINRAEASPR